MGREITINKGRKVLLRCLMFAMLVVAGFSFGGAKTVSAKLNTTSWTVTCDKVGATKTIKIVKPIKGKQQWSSSNKKIATVDKNGKITIVGKKTGSCYIYASIVDGCAVSMGTCKVTIKHKGYTSKTAFKEATVYKAGGNYTTKTCKGCGYVTTSLTSGKTNFVYTESYVSARMEEIVDIINNISPVDASYHDFEGDLVSQTGFGTDPDFIEWAVKAGYIPEDFTVKDELAATRQYDDWRDTDGTLGSYKKGNLTVSADCEAGTYLFEVMLGGYQGYKFVSCKLTVDKLRPGDITYGHDHCGIYVGSDLDENGNGTAYFYTGCAGRIEKDELHVSNYKITTYAYQTPGVAIYRLKNYK